MDKQVIILREIDTLDGWCTSLYNHLHISNVKCMSLDVTNKTVLSQVQQSILTNKNIVLIMSSNTYLSLYEYLDRDDVGSPYAILAIVSNEPQEIPYGPFIANYYLYTFNTNLSNGYLYRLTSRSNYHVERHIKFNSGELNTSILDALKNLSIMFEDVRSKLGENAAKFLIDLTDRCNIPRKDIVSTKVSNVFHVLDMNLDNIDPIFNVLRSGYILNAQWQATITIVSRRYLLVLYENGGKPKYEDLEHMEL